MKTGQQLKYTVRCSDNSGQLLNDILSAYVHQYSKSMCAIVIQFTHRKIEHIGDGCDECELPQIIICEQGCGGSAEITLTDFAGWTVWNCEMEKTYMKVTLIKK